MIGAAPAAAEQKEFADPAGRTRWAHDFGAVGDGEHDDTAALAHGLEWASKNRGVLLLDPGFYAIRSLEIGSQATLRAVAAGGSRFGRDGRQIPAVLVPILGRIDTRPLVTITGTGARLEGVGVTGYNFRQGGDPDDPRGWSTSPGVVVTGGVEVFLADVRVFRVANAGIRVEQLNNARWRDVSIDDCGTIEVPAMRIESVECTNYVTVDGLTIERSANTALDIATGSDPVRDWASNLHFSGLHIESNADGASQHGLNTAPLIDIGNVRAARRWRSGFACRIDRGRRRRAWHCRRRSEVRLALVPRSGCANPTGMTSSSRLAHSGERASKPATRLRFRMTGLRPSSGRHRRACTGGSS